jgi:hypothetical protein
MRDERGELVSVDESIMQLRADQSFRMYFPDPLKVARGNLDDMPSREATWKSQGSASHRCLKGITVPCGVEHGPAREFRVDYTASNDRERLSILLLSPLSTNVKRKRQLPRSSGQFLNSRLLVSVRVNGRGLEMNPTICPLSILIAR